MNNNISSSSKVFICKEELVIQNKNGGEELSKFFNLKHPKLGTAAMYTTRPDGKKIYEIIQQNDGCRSWFVQDVILKDGSLYIISEINPVYLILPYLTNSNNIDKFMQLDAILEDDDFLDIKKLSFCDLPDLTHVTDSKINDGVTYYRYNKEKTLKWLEKRVHFLTKAFKEMNVNINPPSVVPGFEEKTKLTSDSEYLLYSYSTLSEYLDDQLTNDFFSHLKLDDFVGAEVVKPSFPPSKKGKVDDMAPKEDYHQPNLCDVKKAEKLTPSEKKLSKVDKQGMKSISSFFSRNAN